MLIGLSTIIVWIVCGVLHYGLNFAYFQRRFPTLDEDEHKSDKKDALLFSIGGPITLISFIIFLRNGGNKISDYGFKWK